MFANLKILVAAAVLLAACCSALYAEDALFVYKFPASSADLNLGPVDDLGPNNNDGFAGWFSTLSLSEDVPAGMGGQSVDFTEVESGSYRVLHTNDRQLLNTPDVAAGGGFVFDCWFKPTAADIGDTNGTNRHKLFDYCGVEVLEIHQGKLLFRIDEVAYQIYSDALTADAWHHATAVFDTLGNTAVDDPNRSGYQMVNGNMSLYLDDVLVDSIAAVKTGYGDADDGEIGIGRYGPKTGAGSAYGNYDGLVYNPQIWLGNSVGILPGDDSLPGDANLDGTVDSGDALRLAQNWLRSTGVGWGNGDFNNDDSVDDIDAAIMAVNWGRSAAPSSVPEPCTAALMLAMLAFIAAYRLRR